MKNQQKSSRNPSIGIPEATVRLETLSEKDLLARAKKAIQKERYWTNVLINHLLECERRGIHLKRNYSSLHEFAVHYLGLSDGGAHRRIHAMHLMRNIPETEEKLASGKLSLSKAAKLQTFFNAEAKAGSPMSRHEQFEWIERAEPMSSRDLDRAILASASNKAQVLLSERVRSISPDLSEVRWVVPNTLLEKIDQLKSLIYQNGTQTPSQELIGNLIDAELHRQRKRRFGNEGENGIDSSERTALNRSRDVARPKAQKSSPPPLSRDASSVGTQPPTPNKTIAPAAASERPKTSPSKRKPIPAALRRRVWSRAKGQCEFREPNPAETNFPARCSARRSLQIDHIIPISEGGNDDPSNLRLLCGSHNRLRVPVFQ